MASTSADERCRRVRQLFYDAAIRVRQEEDPWKVYDIPNIPAERIIRHIYDNETRSWSTDNTIVKIERSPFTCGAIRFCYRMKMLSQSPTTLLTSSFRSNGWKHASNFIAKAYMKNGAIDFSEDAKLSIEKDIKLQNESQYWAMKFNRSSPPKSISFLQAYAIEFPDRPGNPWMAIERFISGKCSCGVGFMKHNSNSGFVDMDLNRITPQLFSAHSFYSSQGERLVTDIQGVGDLYTDPQVLSSDYRFGDGDLGPRGMALFFKTFQRSPASNAMGIPNFPLSENEITSDVDQNHDGIDSQSDRHILRTGDDEDILKRYAQIDRNRLQRGHIMLPQNLDSDEDMMTMRSSNVKNRCGLSASFRKSMRSIHIDSHIKRETPEICAVAACLERSRNDLVFNHNTIKHQCVDRYSDTNNNTQIMGRSIFNRCESVARRISAPMPVTDLTKKNLGRVHYQLAILHGIGRFRNDMTKKENCPSHDAFSVLFHLSYAAALHCAPACLALARVHVGLNTVVSNLINSIVPVNFNAAKILLRRTLKSPSASSEPKVAAGCLLVQIYHDEGILRGTKDPLNDMVKGQIITETLKLVECMKYETREKKKYVTAHYSINNRGYNDDLCVGDRVEANYKLEGAHCQGVVIELCDSDDNDNDDSVVVRYDEHGSTEQIKRKEARLITPPTVMQTNLGGPLSDQEAFSVDGETDDKILLEVYDMKAELAILKERAGDMTSSSILYRDAAADAIANGNISNGTEWILKAEELEEQVDSGCKLMNYLTFLCSRSQVTQ